jgi:hypothetical protein
LAEVTNTRVVLWGTPGHSHALHLRPPSKSPPYHPAPTSLATVSSSSSISHAFTKPTALRCSPEMFFQLIPLLPFFANHIRVPPPIATESCAAPLHPASHEHRKQPKVDTVVELPRHTPVSETGHLTRAYAIVQAGFSNCPKEKEGELVCELRQRVKK